MNNKQNIVSILLFVAFVYILSSVGFFLWYAKGYEVAAFIPIIAPVTSYFILLGVRKNIPTVNLKNVCVKGVIYSFMLPIIYISFCILVYLLLGKKIFISKLKVSFLVQLVFQWSFAGFCEEVGWRGCLLFMLKKSFTNFVSCIICGLIWTTWHLPMIFNNMILTGVSCPLAIILLSVECIFVTIILDKLMSFNKNSIWTCVSFHAMHNILIQIVLQIIPSKDYIWLDDGGILLLISLALVCVVLCKLKRT